jgi:hypothetical protein
MKNFYSISFGLGLLLLVSCSGGGQKKIVVMASGKLSVSDKTITIEPGTTHNEQDLVFTDSKLTLTVKGNFGGDKTFDIAENGVYLLNLQVDTLIGGLVNYGKSGPPGSITEEALNHIIDSTHQLMEGKNANDAKGPFFLPPGTLKKVSTKDNARIIGSFKGIPASVEVDDSGNTAEIFKFFTNKQKRETINDLEIQRAKIRKL